MKEKSYGICPFFIEDDEIFILLNKTSIISDWNFFKGKIEEKETKKECAIREFIEEARVDLSDYNLDIYFEQRNKRKDIGIFLLKVNNRLDIYQDRKEIFEYSWINIYKSNEISISNNQKKIFNDIFLYLHPLNEYIKYTSITKNGGHIK